jgi:protein SCO1/2
MLMSNAARRGLTIFAIGLAVLVGGLGFETWRLYSGAADGSLAGIAIGGDFTLVDQNGKTRTPADFRGKLMLVYFGYTYCPDVCPTELQTISDALDLLGEKADDVQPLFITVDPERDTPEQLKMYARSFHPSLLPLTGTPQQVDKAARAYKVYYRKAEQTDGEYLMDHSSFVFLMGRDGKYVMHFLPSTTPQQIAAAIEKAL